MYKWVLLKDKTDIFMPTSLFIDCRLYLLITDLPGGPELLEIIFMVRYKSLYHCSYTFLTLNYEILSSWIALVHKFDQPPPENLGFAEAGLN